MGMLNSEEKHMVAVACCLLVLAVISIVFAYSRETVESKQAVAYKVSDRYDYRASVLEFRPHDAPNMLCVVVKDTGVDCFESPINRGGQ